MEKIQKIILFLFIVPIILFVFNVQSVFAIDKSVLIAQLEQEIQSLMRQLIALMQQEAQTKINASKPQVQTNSNFKTATLTVKATGLTAVSINNGPQFAYTLPITLNNGDAYSVTGTSQNGNSTSKCNGTASSGGSYTCNINSY